MSVKRRRRVLALQGRFLERRIYSLNPLTHAALAHVVMTHVLLTQALLAHAALTYAAMMYVVLARVSLTHVVSGVGPVELSDEDFSKKRAEGRSAQCGLILCGFAQIFWDPERDRDDLSLR